MQDITKTYLSKTDEELLELAREPSQLTTEAHSALVGELRKRRLDAAEFPKIREVNEDEIERSGPRQTQSLPDARGVTGFVAEVLRIYHDQFWFFVKLTAPAVVVGYVAVMLSRNEGREIARHLSRGVELLSHKTEILEIELVNLAGYFVSWMAFSFSFGAICSGVDQIGARLVPSVADSFTEVGEHLGPFLRLCVALFFLLLVAEGGVVVVLAGVLWILRQEGARPNSLMIQVMSYALGGLALLILSRFALAMPAVILDGCKVGTAMFRSDELTVGKWPILAALLAKSLIGGYVAGMCPYWLASLVPANAIFSTWLRWILPAASMVGVILAEPPMFIGFAFLYRKMSKCDPPPSI